MVKFSSNSFRDCDQCKINEALIPHYNSKKIKMKKLQKQVKIEPEHLREKDTWYNIDGKLKFFKAREDYRLFTELFCSSFGLQLGYDFVDYSLAYISDSSNKIGPPKKMGLISDNFQVEGKHYYMISDLLRAEVSNFCHYGEYSLTNLLAYFKNQCTPESFQTLKQQFIELYIIDYFLDQIDRNPKNISCELVMKNEGEKYYKALHKKKVGMELSKIFDSEKSLGLHIKHGVVTYQNGTIWAEKFPYARELEGNFEGVPNNLWEVCLDYPEESLEILRRLANENEYKKTLENFQGINKPLIIGSRTAKHIKHDFEKRQKVLKKVIDVIN